MGEIREYWRDVKEHRKKRQSQSPAPRRRRCWDWMVVAGDCHYAKNRSAFKTYRRVRDAAGTLFANAPRSRVIGIGTVELVVKRSPTDPSTNVLVLENVLHIPDAICNGFCAMLNGGYESWDRGGVTQFFEDAYLTRPMFYATEFCGLTRLVLAGNPQGESVLEQKRKDGACFLLSVYLSPEERAQLFSHPGVYTSSRSASSMEDD